MPTPPSPTGPTPIIETLSDISTSSDKDTTARSPRAAALVPTTLSHSDNPTHQPAHHTPKHRQTNSHNEGHPHRAHRWAGLLLLHPAASLVLCRGFGAGGQRPHPAVAAAGHSRPPGTHTAALSLSLHRRRAGARDLGARGASEGGCGVCVLRRQQSWLLLLLFLQEASASSYCIVGTSSSRAAASALQC